MRRRRGRDQHRRSRRGRAPSGGYASAPTQLQALVYDRDRQVRSLVAQRLPEATLQQLADDPATEVREAAHERLGRLASMS